MQQQLIDRCPQCNGIYFDKGELESLVQLVRLFRVGRLDEPDIDTIPEAEKGRPLCCPHDGTVMGKKEIGSQVIDICPKCEGIWLDDQEIVALKIAENHIKSNLRLYIRLGEES